MKAEEIEARMAAQQPVLQQAPPLPQPVGELVPMVRPIQRTAEQHEQARERAEEAKRAERRARVEHQRSKLAPRIDRRLLTRLVTTRTPCALLLGPTGTGKTSAALWLQAGFGGSLVHARELGSCERRHGLGEGYAPLLEEARRARVLYLDDVGAEEARDLGVIQYTLEYRYARGLPTVVTTGLGQAELSSHLGAAYVRRIVEQHVAKRDGGEWPVLVCDLFGGGQ